MLRVKGSPVQQYSIVVLAVTLALALTFWLRLGLPQTTFPLFYIAVAISAWHGGLKPGLLATGLSGLVILLFLTPIYLSTDSNIVQAGRLGLFLGVGLFMTLLSAQSKRTKQQVEKAIRSLQTSEERYRRLVETAYEGIWVLDVEGNTDYVNQRMSEMLGYTLAEMEHRPILDFMDDIARQEATQNLKRRQQGIAEQHDFRFRRKDGSDLWTLVVTNPILSETGQYLGTLGMITDLSDRKQMEASLRQSNEMISSILERITDGFVAFDTAGRYTYINSAAQKILLKQPAEVLGKTIAEAFPDLPESDFDREFRRAVAEQVKVSLEAYVPSLNIWAHVYAYPSSNGLSVFFQDITEAKRYELERQQTAAALQQSEERLQRFANSDLIGILFGDVYGSLSYVNDAFLRIVGYARHEFELGKIGWDTLTPAEYLPLDDIGIAEAQATGACTPYEKEYIRKDGTRVAVLVGYVLSGEQREESIAFIMDITERKRSDAALRESEARFRHLADTAPVLIWMSGTDKLCTYFNQSWLDFTGRSLTEEIGEGWATGVYGDDLAQLLETYNTAFDARQEFKMECRLRRFDGQYRWMFDHGVPRFTTEGEFLGYIGSCIDIDDRKQAEANVLQLTATLEQRVKDRTAQLEIANQELESFSYSVSHDLRAPLRHISGFVDLLQRRLQPNELDETSQHYMQTIADTSKQAGVLIDNLLSFSRMGRTEMRFKTTDMNQLIAEVRRALEPEIAGRTIQWQVEPLPTIQGDPALLRSVFYNLVENALKYTQPRSDPEIAIGSTSQTHETIFWIRDNGVGFDMRYVHKLFGVFQRLHRADEFEGTGIGLANVQRIIRRHGGRVWAEAEVDRGATFYVSLPKPKDSQSPG